MLLALTLFVGEVPELQGADGTLGVDIGSDAAGWLKRRGPLGGALDDDPKDPPLQSLKVQLHSFHVGHVHELPALAHDVQKTSGAQIVDHRGIPLDNAWIWAMVVSRAPRTLGRLPGLATRLLCSTGRTPAVTC